MALGFLKVRTGQMEQRRARGKKNQTVLLTQLTEVQAKAMKPKPDEVRIHGGGWVPQEGKTPGWAGGRMKGRRIDRKLRSKAGILGLKSCRIYCLQFQ